MITQIQMEHGLYENSPRLFLKFPYDNETISFAKNLQGIKWSKSKKAWHIPFNKDAPMLVINLFALKGIKVNYLNEKIPTPKPVPAKPQMQLEVLRGDSEQKIESFKNWMRSRRYSESTIGTYTDALRLFLRFYSHKPIHEISNDDLITFNNDYILKNKLSSSHQNQVVNGIKLFFRTVENSKLNPELVHRPKREKILPNVLSKEEVKLILDALPNIKHKAMLSLIYSCGLRCSEILHLKPENIDSIRKLVIIKQAKGRKDRVVPLSDKILVLLREYWKLYQPNIWLFEGQKEGETYDERSLQQVLKKAVYTARIKKPVTLHWLRHSYATHLLENGTNLRYIQEMLGHRSSKTTEIYTHVSSQSIQKIASPFDYL